MGACEDCGSPMVLATESRGYQTYRCKRGCSCYKFVEIPVAPTAKPNWSGLMQQLVMELQVPANPAVIH